ncbi:ABC transporter ATP-binding protein [Miltoncostaea marina]|uniref:ABC transporter ATP-binding protein n=1 Tax=Miltoncostaea marina TaxID=2843215 RepID=UPI001C3D4842|nr:ABC transporter ATP-binding protein [Miltoncostaea marina]
MASVEFEDVGKVYPGGARAVEDFDLTIEDREFMVLVGPSGCGKTTALRMVAGLEDISEGRIRIGERVVNRVPSKDRDIAMVFQSYALYPHLKVYDNIAFGLRLQKTDKAEIDRRVRAAAQSLGLTEYLDRKPGALSGGQRQRVAMGRAIVRRPQVFLMDEPLSNLDAKLRVQTRAEISKLQDDLGVTTLYVTHDQVEAMTMGDRVAVMRKGRLQQVDSPQEVYDHPVNIFVAGFIGSPAMNLLEARLEADGDGAVAVLGEQRLVLGRGLLEARPGIRAHAGRRVILGIRPEDMEDAALKADWPADRRLRGSVELREALGSEIHAHVRLPGARAAETEQVAELAADAGGDGGAPIMEGAEGTLVVARVNPRSGVREGDATELAIDTDRVHVFDPESGAAVYGDQTTTGGGAG